MSDDAFEELRFPHSEYRGGDTLARTLHEHIEQCNLRARSLVSRAWVAGGTLVVMAASVIAAWVAMANTTAVMLSRLDVLKEEIARDQSEAVRRDDEQSRRLDLLRAEVNDIHRTQAVVVNRLGLMGNDIGKPQQGP